MTARAGLAHSDRFVLDTEEDLSLRLLAGQPGGRGRAPVVEPKLQVLVAEPAVGG